MGLILIVAGFIAIVVGIVLVYNGSKNTPESSTATVTPSQSPIVKQNDTGEDSLSSKEKGDLFEDFTINLLADWRMRLLDRTQDKVSTAGVVAESCRQPDLHIQQKRGESKVDYYLECKYRSDWKEGKISFDEWQIKRYRDFQRSSHRKVLIALGVGGSPSKPETLMLVPIDSVKDNYISQTWVTKYAIQPTTDALASYIDSYFDNVFTVAKDRKESHLK